MVISILKKKYQCGCNKGQSDYESPNLLWKLNSIIEKYGDDLNIEELKPGDVFQVVQSSGSVTVIACDSEDRVVQVVSETGPLALKRIMEDIVFPEFELINTDTQCVYSLSLEKVDKNPDNLETVPVDFNKMSIIKDRIMYRPIHHKPFVFEVKLSHDITFGQEVSIWFTKNNWYYDPNEIEGDLIQSIIDDVMGYIYKNIPRLPIPKVNREMLKTDPMGFVVTFAEMTDDEKQIFYDSEELTMEEILEINTIVKDIWDKLQEVQKHEENANSGNTAQVNP